MKFLFSHRNFPAQFRHVLLELSKDPSNEIVFVTGTKNNVQIAGVKKYEYKLKREVSKNCHRYLRTFEEAVVHGQAAAEVVIKLKNKGFKPDVIYAHPWGNSMYLKDIFPDARLINFCEWYYKSENSDIDFSGERINEDRKAKTRTMNASLLIDLVSCDKGICPTQWQKSQFPKEFQHKIEVLHDGIDTDYFVPNPEAVLKIHNTNIELTAKDQVVTYATRGMEPYRGFPQFMEMAEKLLKRRPNVHIVIGGEDRICYGPKLEKGTFKQIMLDKLDLDLSRVHFTGDLPYMEYKKLLQISSAHVYPTYPFVLSWSMLEAMSCGCCVVGSKTTPIEEVIIDKKNIEIFDPETLSFTNYDKKLLDNNTMFNVLSLDKNNAIWYTDNNIYTLNLYNFKLNKVFTQKNKISCVITISENVLIILQNDYHKKQVLISKFNIKENKIVYQNKLNFNCANAINIDSKNIMIVDKNNNIYVYNLEQEKIIKNAEFSIYEFYGTPQLLKLKNNNVFILYGLLKEYPFLSNKVFIYDNKINKFIEGEKLCYDKRDFANLVELKDGSILISGGQYDEPNDNSSDLSYLRTTQIYK